MRKRVICLIGLPGCGKSSAARFLKNVLGAPNFHLPDVVGHLIPPEERESARRHARLLTGLEPAFLDEVDKCVQPAVVLDGFLRSGERVRILHQTARQKGWSIEILHLRMGGLRGLIRSVRRQWQRDGVNDFYRVYRKLRRDLLGTPLVLRAAAELAIPVYDVDALNSETGVQEQIRRRLGLDLQLLPWDRELLRQIASVAPDAWVTGGGHLYRPFFEGRYGPPADSWDVDLRVWGQARAEEVQAELSARFPERRWHVKDALSWARKELGRDVASVEETLAANALICICAGTRWRNGVEVHWGHPEAEADLRAGFLRPNPDGQSGFAEAKARRIIDYYPGVSAPFLGYQPVDIESTFDAAMARSRGEERGGARKPAEWEGWEKELAGEILAVRRSLPCAPQCVPWPPPAPFPDGDPWMAEDRSFRVWVVNQTRSRSPAGGRDSYLEQALRIQRGVRQKPIHCAWSLHLHALHALLQLETGGLAEFRRPMRIAMLWHDIGKLWNVQTPGAHPAIGAKKWLSMQATRLPGMEDAEEALISHFIACHDLFGRLERGLWDEGYQGAMSPAAVRSALESPLLPAATMLLVAKALWLADIGSVPLLRWIRPLADPIERLIGGRLTGSAEVGQRPAQGSTAG